MLFKKDDNFDEFNLRELRLNILLTMVRVVFKSCDTGLRRDSAKIKQQQPTVAPGAVVCICLMGMRL